MSRKKATVAKLETTKKRREKRAKNAAIGSNKEGTVTKVGDYIRIEKQPKFHISGQGGGHHRGKNGPVKAKKKKTANKARGDYRKTT